MCLDCLCKQHDLCWTPAIPSGNLEFYYMPGRGCLCDQDPVKTLDTTSLTVFSPQKHGTCCHISTTGEKRALGDPLMGKREHREAYTWIPSDCACVFFPHDPDVYPYYNAINLHCEYNHILSPASPSSESLNMGWSGSASTQWWNSRYIWGG